MTTETSSQVPHGGKINGINVETPGINGYGTKVAEPGDAAAARTAANGTEVNGACQRPRATQPGPGAGPGAAGQGGAATTSEKTAGGKADPSNATAQAVATDPTLDAVRAVVHRAQRGDTSVLPELRKALAEHPDYFAGQGDLSLMSETVWLQSFAGKNLFLRVTIEQDLARLRRDLTRPDASPLEKLMVDNVVSCWRQLQYADTLHAAAQDQPEATRKNLMKQQESAQRRYSDSLQQLDKMQKRRPTAVKLPKASAADASSQANGPAAPAASDDPLVAFGRTLQGEATRRGTSVSPHAARVESADLVSEFPRISPDHEADALLNGVGVDG